MDFTKVGNVYYSKKDGRTRSIDTLPFPLNKPPPDGYRLFDTDGLEPSVQFPYASGVKRYISSAEAFQCAMMKGKKKKAELPADQAYQDYHRLQTKYALRFINNHRLDGLI